MPSYAPILLCNADYYGTLAATRVLGRAGRALVPLRDAHHGLPFDAQPALRELARQLLRRAPGTRALPDQRRYDVPVRAASRTPDGARQALAAQHLVDHE